jgi:hypothetical protein
VEVQEVRLVDTGNEAVVSFHISLEKWVLFESYQWLGGCSLLLIEGHIQCIQWYTEHSCDLPLLARAVWLITVHYSIFLMGMKYCSIETKSTFL